MSERLAIALTLATLTLAGCSDGEDARSTTAGKAPYNAKVGETETQSGPEGSTATNTTTGTSTATSSSACNGGEDDKTLVFENNVSFTSICKGFSFTTPGEATARVMGNAEGPDVAVIFLNWDSGDGVTPPTVGKVYTEAEKNGDGKPMAEGVLAVLEKEEASAKTSKITFKKLPLTAGSDYELTFEFTVDHPNFPGKTVSFSGTVAGKRP